MTETTSLPAPGRAPSVAHWTLQAITLPFTGTGRLGLAGLPFLVLGGMGFLQGGAFFYGFVAPLSLVTMTVPALQEFGRITMRMSSIQTIGLFISLLTLAFWLCAWQRAVATRFREPIADWLVASLRRMPQYLAIFGVLATLSLVMFALSNALYSQNLWLAGFPMVRPDGMLQAQAPLAIILALLCALYAYVRIAPLAALVASEWNGNLLDAMRRTRGVVGLRLYLAFAGLLVLSWALCVGSRNFSLVIAGADWPGYAYYFTRLLALLTQIWLATLAALSAAPDAEQRQGLT